MPAGALRRVAQDRQAAVLALSSSPHPAAKSLLEAHRDLARQAASGALTWERGISEETIRAVCYGNALAAYGQSGQMSEDDWLNASGIDQSTLYEGNSILRGGRDPKIERSSPAERKRQTIID